MKGRPEPEQTQPCTGRRGIEGAREEGARPPKPGVPVWGGRLCSGMKGRVGLVLRVRGRFLSWCRDQEHDTRAACDF